MRLSVAAALRVYNNCDFGLIPGDFLQHVIHIEGAEWRQGYVLWSMGPLMSRAGTAALSMERVLGSRRISLFMDINDYIANLRSPIIL